MKRLFVLLLTLMVFCQSGCGSGEAAADPPEVLETEAEFLAEQPEQAKESVRIQDPGAFFHGLEPSEVKHSETGATIVYYDLPAEKRGMASQYSWTLTEENYNLELIRFFPSTDDDAFLYAYYLKYTGPEDVGVMQLEQDCHVFLGLRAPKDGSDARFGLFYAEGIALGDDGYRADLTALEEPESEPEPEPEPAGPEVIPDFLENDTSGAFRAGTSNFDYAVCFLADDNTYYSAAEAYVQLLVDMGYTITGTDEKAMRTWNRMQWNLYYEGVDWPTIEENTHVRVKHLARNRDGKRSTEISIGYSEGITYGGEEQYQGGGSGGSTGGGSWDPYTPDASKLPCLTCGGSGDCTRCGGSGYVGFGDARAACGQCHKSGNCRVCGGSGTR